MYFSASFSDMTAPGPSFKPHLVILEIFVYFHTLIMSLKLLLERLSKFIPGLSFGGSKTKPSPKTTAWGWGCQLWAGLPPQHRQPWSLVLLHTQPLLLSASPFFCFCLPFFKGLCIQGCRVAMLLLAVISISIAPGGRDQSPAGLNAARTITKRQSWCQTTSSLLLNVRTVELRLP